MFGLGLSLGSALDLRSGYELCLGWGSGFRFGFRFGFGFGWLGVGYISRSLIVCTISSFFP